MKLVSNSLEQAMSLKIRQTSHILLDPTNTKPNTQKKERKNARNISYKTMFIV